MNIDPYSNFSIRVNRCFSMVNSIEILSSKIKDGTLELTELTDKVSSSTARANLAKGCLSYYGNKLNPKYISNVFNEIVKPIDIDENDIIWFGFDIDKKYFILIYKLKSDIKVIYWTPNKTNINKINIIKEFILPKGKFVKGRFIDLIEKGDNK